MNPTDELFEHAGEWRQMSRNMRVLAKTALSRGMRAKYLHDAREALHMWIRCRAHALWLRRTEREYEQVRASA